MARWNVFDTISGSNAIATWCERLWRTAAVFGVDGWIKALVGAAIIPAYAMLTHFVGPSSWWIAAPIALAFTTFALKSYTAFRAAIAIRGVRAPDLQQLAFRADVMRFRSERADTTSGHITFVTAIGPNP